MNESTGKLILRVTLGIPILLHGISKLMSGVDRLDGMLANAGFYSRIGAWLIAVSMLFAFGVVHAGDLFKINPEGGGLAAETQYLFLFTAVAVALIGPGRYAFNQK